jgi:hypothetical protein
MIWLCSTVTAVTLCLPGPLPCRRWYFRRQVRTSWHVRVVELDYHPLTGKLVLSRLQNICCY